MAQDLAYNTTRQIRTAGFRHSNVGKRGLVSSKISFVLCSSLVILLLFVCIGAGYLIVKDDLVSATLARHARMQHAYEDRITALRAQVDIVTSRQLLDQRAVESRVERLMARQQSLSRRESQISKALARAVKARASERKKPLTTGSLWPAAKFSPNKSANLRLGSLVGTHSPFNENSQSRTQIASQNNAGINVRKSTFDKMERSLAQTELAQLNDLHKARRIADAKANRLTKVLTRIGQKHRDLPQHAIGGPLIELKSGDRFLDSMHALDTSLTRLANVRKFASALPHGSPTPGQAISSRYGGRTDPFTGRHAVHSGLDFKAKNGTPVHATAAGIIVTAGRKGGYGILVEIDHQNGLTTRYAHLSRVHVKVGERVKRGKIVGKVGSTGRSTGPHLHYEVRKNGQTRNPINFVRLDRLLKPYL
ncbi:MAG: peptidase [Hyphomicrobiales bacterium]|nr:MAG: peptidase [Hyphomicrobiales bacterium]